MKELQEGKDQEDTVVGKGSLISIQGMVHMEKGRMECGGREW